MTSSSSSNTSTVVLAAVSSTMLAFGGAYFLYQNVQAQAKREERYRWVQAEIDAEEDDHEDRVLPSIIGNFHAFQLEYGATVEEANKKRTTKYYEAARDAHKYDLVPSIRSYPRLRNKREAELERIYRYRDANKSHRTVVVMCDAPTSDLLDEARNDILRPLNYSHDIATPEVWIPAPNIIPKNHLHVTVAIPWWWHGMRAGNEELSQELVNRFRQALVTEFHHAFQLELERIVLLGGKTLVGLWRCIGEREAPNEFVIFDRHGSQQDPLVKLRRDIVECFTSENNRWGQQPLTYSHRHYSNDDNNNTPAKARPSDGAPQKNANAQLSEAELPPAKAVRRNTIELKTPGLSGSDGFIHTTLARLPIDCLSMTDVELEPIHRLCREATATCAGHRMVVSKFRFVETTGIGSDSDPCEQPIFDEVVECPPKVGYSTPGGDIQQLADLYATKIVDRNATLGALPPAHSPKPSILVDGLFDEPVPGVKVAHEIESAIAASTTGAEQHPLKK